MIFHPKHDYLILLALFVLVIAAIGAVALHYGETTAGEAAYHPCQLLYQDYEKNNCRWLPEQHACRKILVEIEARGC